MRVRAIRGSEHIGGMGDDDGIRIGLPAARYWFAALVLIVCGLVASGGVASAQLNVVEPPYRAETVVIDFEWDTEHLLFNYTATQSPNPINDPSMGSFASWGGGCSQEGAYLAEDVGPLYLTTDDQQVGGYNWAVGSGDYTLVVEFRGWCMYDTESRTLAEAEDAAQVAYPNNSTVPVTITARRYADGADKPYSVKEIGTVQVPINEDLLNVTVVAGVVTVNDTFVVADGGGAEAPVSDAPEDDIGGQTTPGDAAAPSYGETSTDASSAVDSEAVGIDGGEETQFDGAADAATETVPIADTGARRVGVWAVVLIFIVALLGAGWLARALFDRYLQNAGQRDTTKLIARVLQPEPPSSPAPTKVEPTNTTKTPASPEPTGPFIAPTSIPGVEPAAVDAFNLITQAPSPPSAGEPGWDWHQAEITRNIAASDPDRHVQSVFRGEWYQSRLATTDSGATGTQIRVYDSSGRVVREGWFF